MLVLPAVRAHSLKIKMGQLKSYRQQWGKCVHMRMRLSCWANYNPFSIPFGSARKCD